MAQKPQLSQLCELCEHVNFAGILTPRDIHGTEKTGPIYRPQYSGNGSTPIALWMDTKERKSKKYPRGSVKVNLPITKTVYYEDLSDSDEDDAGGKAPQVRVKDRALVVVGSNDDIPDNSGCENANDREGDSDDDSVPDEVQKKLAAELDDLELDNDSADASDDHEGVDDKSVNMIDLNLQAAGNLTYWHGQLYYLGTIWDVRSRRRRCDLCRMLWSKMRTNIIVKNQLLTKSRCILKLMDLKGRKVEDPAKEVSVLHLVFIYAYKLDYPVKGDWIVKTPAVFCGTHRDVCEHDDRISPGQIPTFRDEHYGEARWTNDQCNFGLLQAWLKTCVSKHNHSALDTPIKVKIRLVDVVQMCLVEFDAANSTVPDYVALSYTWGASKPRNMLNTSQLEQCKTPGFFNSDELNTTFRDALTLCSNMGQKYLWVDALCIVQDDPNDKLQQIPQMREIYGQSLFTIIAAHGDNADAGLPRISAPKNRQTKFELKDIRIQLKTGLKIYHAKNKLDIGIRENYMRGCVYLSRAWTYQEGFLSPRVMVFTGSQIYWECDRCTWCENVHWESDSIDFVGLRAIKGTTPDDMWNDRFERHAYDRYREDYEPSPSSYPVVIKEYSNRNLTRDDDILHACNGVLAYIKEQEQSDFLFGLREKHFGNDLLFNYWTAVVPRFPGTTATESGFPSWSWAAWKGSVQIACQARGNSYDLADNLIPCDGVRCFTLQIDEQGQPNIRVINKTGGWKFELGYVRRGEGIYDPTEQNYEYNHTTEKFRRGDRLKPIVIPDNNEYSDDELSDDTENHNDETDDRLTQHDVEIPIYDQNITLSELQRHPAYSTILKQPSLHIAFKTFSTLVIVVLDYDDYAVKWANPSIGGSVTLRSEGCWGNKDEMSRKVYACRKIQDPYTPRLYDACPCCGKDNKRDLLPAGYELGPYLGRLPAISSARDRQEYLRAIPNGLYRMLWMNNNQLPLFGHLLCKPVSPTASRDGDWGGEVMQRMSAVIGPIEIITKDRQEHYCAEWGTHILA